jgi:hypothetical protein
VNEPEASLARIEQLLQEGNALRREAIAIQREAVEMQKSLMDQQRDNLARAAQINEGAAAIQKRAKGAISIVIPILVVLIVYVSYLLLRPHP